MITRRRFVQWSALAASSFAGALFAQEPSASRGPIRLGAQLFTVRAMAKTDLPGALRAVRSIGYREIELIPEVYDRPAEDLRRTITASGLAAPSAHFGFEKFPSRFDYARALGLQWMVCPMIPHAMHSKDGFRRAADQLNRWGRQAKPMGMRVGYHNHNYEFQRFGSETGYDILVRNTNPELVYFEVDCYWVAEAGHDPVSLMKQLGKRARLLHLKDRKPGFPASTKLGPGSGHFTEVGRGSLDWPAILAEARKIGVEHYFVEQDETSGPPMESLKISYQYLHKELDSMHG